MSLPSVFGAVAKTVGKKVAGPIGLAYDAFHPAALASDQNLAKDSALANSIYKGVTTSRPTFLNGSFSGGNPTGPAGPAGGGAAYNANTDPGAVASNRQQAATMIDNLNKVYESLFHAIDTQTADKRGQLDTSYNQQFADQDKNLNKAQDQTMNVYAARGAGNSSANAVAQGENVDTYNTDRQNLLNDRGSKYAQLGQFAATTKSKYSADRPAVDLSRYNDVNSLVSLRDQLDQHIKSVQGAESGLGTDEQFTNTLNSIAPAQSNLASQLTDKFAKLTASSAPDSAKNAIGQGYLKLAGVKENDPLWGQLLGQLSKPQTQAA